MYNRISASFALELTMISMIKIKLSKKAFLIYSSIS